jgi:phospholipase C
VTNLDKIEHVVVVMLENRSFDHMLGYLMRDGMPEVDGLTGHEVNYDPEGNPHEAHELDLTAIATKPLDPCHSPECVVEQLAEFHGQTPGGYVKNFVERKNPASKDDWGVVMGHYAGAHLPAYDHLAREFCVCDRWFSSVPGATWPNRLYSIAGKAQDGNKDDIKPPIYELESFVRHLDDWGVSWRWYAHDPATLRAIDKQYRSLTRLHRDNFAYFNKKVSILTRIAEALIVEQHDSFLDDAAKGELRSVSWIDPNFIDLHLLDPRSNDDHPPSDIRYGQTLVMSIYHALRTSPNWDKTLLVVTYDEHGGFYDHVVPPAADDDDPAFRSYGVRVPALVISPWVARGQVSHTTFDHTSLIKTIFTRFKPDGAPMPDMGARVAAANDLGELLTEPAPRDVPEHQTVLERLRDWHRSHPLHDLFHHRAPDEAGAAGGRLPGEEIVLSDFQEGFLMHALALREEGLPAGQP